MIDFNRIYTQRDGMKVKLFPWTLSLAPDWAVYGTTIMAGELAGSGNGARDKNGKYPSELGQSRHDIIDLHNQSHVYYLEE